MPSHFSTPSKAMSHNELASRIVEMIRVEASVIHDLIAREYDEHRVLHLIVARNTLHNIAKLIESTSWAVISGCGGGEK